MKNLLIFLLIGLSSQLSSKSITITSEGGNCAGSGMATLEFYEVRNGRNSYFSDIGGGLYSIIEWRNGRWENNLINAMTGVYQNMDPFFYNEANTSPNPPCFTFDPNWVSFPPCDGTTITNLTGACFAPPIPTLSQWSIIFLSLSLLILGIVGLKQKGYIFS